MKYPWPTTGGCVRQQLAHNKELHDTTRVYQTRIDQIEWQAFKRTAFLWVLLIVVAGGLGLGWCKEYWRCVRIKSERDNGTHYGNIYRDVHKRVSAQFEEWKEMTRMEIAGKVETEQAKAREEIETQRRQLEQAWLKVNLAHP